MASAEYQAVTRKSAADLAEVLPSQEEAGWTVVSVTESHDGHFTAIMRRTKDR